MTWSLDLERLYASTKPHTLSPIQISIESVEKLKSGQGFDFRPEFLRKHQKCSIKSREVRKWIGRESSPKELVGNSFDLPGDRMSLISTNDKPGIDEYIEIFTLGNKQ